MEKVFLIDTSALKPLATGYGTCLVTDSVTVDGLPIGYVYREVPESAEDSGWRFFDGSELPDYLAEAENFATFDVNTIANHDPAVLPCLDAAVGTAYTRTPQGFVKEPSFDDEE